LLFDCRSAAAVNVVRMARTSTVLDMSRPSHQRLVIALFLSIVFPISVVLAIGAFLALL